MNSTAELFEAAQAPYYVVTDPEGYAVGVLKGPFPYRTLQSGILSLMIVSWAEAAKFFPPDLGRVEYDTFHLTPYRYPAGNGVAWRLMVQPKDLTLLQKHPMFR